MDVNTLKSKVAVYTSYSMFPCKSTRLGPNRMGGGELEAGDHRVQGLPRDSAETSRVMPGEGEMSFSGGAAREGGKNTPRYAVREEDDGNDSGGGAQEDEGGNDDLGGGAQRTTAATLRWEAGMSQETPLEGGRNAQGDAAQEGGRNAPGGAVREVGRNIPGDATQ